MIKSETYPAKFRQYVLIILSCEKPAVWMFRHSIDHSIWKVSLSIFAFLKIKKPQVIASITRNRRPARRTRLLLFWPYADLMFMCRTNGWHYLGRRQWIVFDSRAPDRSRPDTVRGWPMLSPTMWRLQRCIMHGTEHDRGGGGAARGREGGLWPGGRRAPCASHSNRERC